MQNASRSAQVGLFGGTFNPPHLAHLVIAELVCEQFDLDRVVWIPNFQSPFKGLEDTASADHRVAMTRLAVEDNDRFEMNEIEVRREGVSYMIDTIRTLQERHPDVAFHLIIGSDSLESFGAWREPQEIVDRVRLIVFRRPGAAGVSAPSGLRANVGVAEAPLLEISGTTIRDRIRAGRSVRYMLPEPVRSYIFDHGLYGSSRHAPPA